MCSCISASGTVNQRQIGARGLSMRGETIREHARDGQPAPRPILSAGPPRETSTLATPCRKTPYARRKTRTPQPRGQGVHSEPFGAPVSRAPLEVVRAEQTSNRKLGFGSLGGLDDPSWDAQNSDFGPKSVSGHPDEPPAQSPPRERRCRGKEIASTAMQPHRIPGSARPDRPPPACNRT
jgi:hypothetical protein